MQIYYDKTRLPEINKRSVSFDQSPKNLSENKIGVSKS